MSRGSQVYIFQYLQVPLDVQKEETNSYVLDERHIRVFHSKENKNQKISVNLVHSLIYERLPDNMGRYSESLF